MKSTGGFVLGLIGSIGNILISILGLIFTILLSLVFVGLDVSSKIPDMTNSSLITIILFGLLSIWFLIAGILGIVYSIKINKELEVRKGSIGCFIFGILTLSLFMVLGAIVGIVKSKKGNIESPYPLSPAPVPQQGVQQVSAVQQLQVPQQMQNTPQPIQNNQNLNSTQI